MPTRKTLPLEPLVVSVDQAAHLEGCGKTDIYRRIAAGEYDAFKDGKRLRITLASIKRRQASLPRAVIKHDARSLAMLEQRRRREAEAEAAAEEVIT
jgi:hypothetical protein